MAREYAPIRLAIWGDDEFRSLSPRAQHLYFVLLTSPSLNYCGVTDWRPGRIAAMAGTWTAEGVNKAAAELVRGLYIVVDEGTEEVLVRSFVKHDGLMKNPKTAVSMALAFAGTASVTLRGVVVHELQKLRQNHPELKGWEPEKVRELLTRNAIDPAALPMEYEEALGVVQPLDYPLGLGVDLLEGLPVDQPEDFDEPLGEGLPEGSLPAPAPNQSSSSMSGYVTGVPHEADASEPPSPHCSQHPGGTLDRCGSCGDARRARERFDVEHARHAAAVRAGETRRQAELRAAAIAHCRLCDAEGYADGRVCDHDPEALERNRRGSAGARIAACRMCDENGLRADSSECDHKLRRGDRSENR